MKRMMDALRIEYETKVYELGEDITLLSRRLEKSAQSKHLSHDDNDTLKSFLQELEIQNQSILEQLHAVFI